MNALKTKWRTEARRMFNESIAYHQKCYKQMLAVEELGFLKSADDFSVMKASLSQESKPSMNPAESSMSIMTSSSSYEKINDDLTGSQFWSVPEEVDE